MKLQSFVAAAAAFVAVASLAAVLPATASADDWGFGRVPSGHRHHHRPYRPPRYVEPPRYDFFYDDYRGGPYYGSPYRTPMTNLMDRVNRRGAYGRFEDGRFDDGRWHDEWDD